MISNIRANAIPALIVTWEKERKTFALLKNYLTAMINLACYCNGDAYIFDIAYMLGYKISE